MSPIDIGSAVIFAIVVGIAYHSVVKDMSGLQDGIDRLSSQVDELEAQARAYRARVNRYEGEME